MPTENLSNNTEMVSVQATIESLEEAYAGDSALEFMNDAAQLLRQFKSLSTLEHQGEPVAYIEAADLRDIACGSPWGGTVWGRQSREPYPPRVPVYTHADPGEVERLKSTAEHFTGVSIKAAEDVSRLRAKLIELESSVREFLRIDGLSVDGSAARNKALKMLAATLSASAEPSAPVEIDERAVTNAFHDWAFYKKGEAIGRMDGQQAALEGFIAGADWQARAALERNPS